MSDKVAWWITLGIFVVGGIVALALAALVVTALVRMIFWVLP
jgi:hypothetical protein